MRGIVMDIIWDLCQGISLVFVEFKKAFWRVKCKDRMYRDKIIKIIGR